MVKKTILIEITTEMITVIDETDPKQACYHIRRKKDQFIVTHHLKKEHNYL